jgi:hypothetical protein
MFQCQYSPVTFLQPAKSSSGETSVDAPFLVVFLNNRIKKCYGCAREFSRKCDGGILGPPNDIVVLHEAYREYYRSGKKLSSPRPQNTYFHPSVSCIRAKYPSFVPQCLNIDGVREKLLPVHLKYLNALFSTSIFVDHLNFSAHPLLLIAS